MFTEFIPVIVVKFVPVTTMVPAVPAHREVGRKEVIIGGGVTIPKLSIDRL